MRVSLALMGSTAAILGGAFACSAVLGIEKLQPDNGVDASAGIGGSEPDSSISGGGSGDTGSAGDAGTKGGAGNGGGGASSDGGTSSGGKGGTSAGGAGGSIIAPDGGDGGPAVTGVTGTLIDYHLQPVSNAIVTIGSTTVQTDQKGVFTIPDVPSGPYDVQIAVTTQRNNSTATFGWIFQGISRRDPTLDIYRGRPEQYGSITFHNDNVTFPLPDTDQIGWAFASADANYESTMDTSPYTDDAVSWVGPTKTSGTAHALLFSFTAWASGIPQKYTAYNSAPVAFDTAASTPATVVLDLAKPTPAITVGTIAGTVTATGSGQRENQIWLHFPDGANIQVANDSPAPDNYSYPVPTIAGSSFIVAATSGDSYYVPYGVAFQSNVAVGQAGVDLQVPTPATLLAPASDAANVDGKTVFKWAGGSSVSVLHFECNISYNALFVVTAAKQVSLPTFTGTQFALPTGQDYCFWSVEGHGTATGMDDATKGPGMLSSMANGRPDGRNLSGTFTESERRTFHLPN